MNTVSMRLPAKVRRDVKRRAAELKMSRTQYIREAVLAMNRALDLERRRARMRAASRKVRAESLKVNAEFAAIEHAPD